MLVHLFVETHIQVIDPIRRTTFDRNPKRIANYLIGSPVERAVAFAGQAVAPAMNGLVEPESEIVEVRDRRGSDREAP